ncbi:nuclear receptor coactivator 3 isoform X10 [Nasonia vitripennis]|uniref:Nuclear receptor coactivator 2 n=1 Tax=Nasonia vitripennis TaxID=7425 RepID=A0A7M7QQQ8_NASVI|nr:nuclear receptor coactivator 3 isoform X10 [Nasonia vitripennis]
MSIAAAENAGPGPCDLRDPLWVKMNAITGITTKKRKKSDAKPQSQINKCLNEKRRRTQENLFIDELAELISATDMSSGKTDKCQILQRTVEQIRHINTHTGSNSHAVQQGEVSSSNPSILSNDQVGPILLEALDGFLFIVNTEGRVEYVTDNITEYINYTKNDVLGKDIYNIIHHGDHNNFMPNILPMSVGWSSEPQTQTRNRTFECRFLVKPPDDKEETMEEKQQRVSKYETMQICSALLPSNGASSGSERLEPGGGSSAASNVVGGNDVSSEFSDIGPCVMCVARRISFDEKRIGQFTLKLDTFGKIMAVDTNWLSPSYSQYLSNKNLINTKIQDLCHPSDLSKLTAHLKDAIEVGESMSPIYRLHISSEKFLNVQTKSKLFKASVANKRETDFIMATNSIFSPLQESQSASLGGASTPSSVQPPQLQHNQPSPMDHRSNGPSQLEPAEQQQQQQQSQPQQQVSTESGRLRNLLTKGSSASDDSCQENASTQPGGGQAGPEADKPSQTNRILKILLNQQDEDDYHSSEHAGPKAMRNSPGQQVQPKHSPHEHKPNVGPSNNMLLQLLNEKNDDDDEETRAGMKKRNELLTQLLKEPEDEKKVLDQKNRDDDPLLRSLGFRNNSPSSSQSDHSSGSVGLTTGQKRPVEDGEMNVAVKRAMDGSQVTSTASSSSSGSSNNPSKLWEKNRMLASLLAKQPTQPATIPPIPASVISATPQDKLPRVLDRSKQQQQQHQQQHQQQQQQQQHQQQQQQPWTSMQSVGSNSTTTTATSARTPMQNQSRQLPRQPTNTYLTHLQQVTKMEQMDSDFMGNRDYRQQGTDPSAWDIQSALDPDLSDILDQVIDIAPEGIADSLLDAVQAQRNERLAINAIQESLMQIETAVNPTSSNITMPGTPPAYSTALANTPVTSSHNYQPPPMYQQPQQQQQARMRLNTQQAGNRQAAAQFSPQQQQQQQLQRKLMQQQQQQMKQRLLQQQQQQQVLISTATATDQITAGIHTLDNLLNNLNNTVAPNVSLQRSSVPDSQVSPSYGGSVQMPQGQHRLTHSYSHPSTLPQHPAVNNSFNSGQQVSAAARLSPHSPAGIMSFSHPQPLSPRVTQQGNYASSPRMFNVNQVRQQQQPGQQPGLQQQQRSMSSPGTPVSARQSPFPAEAFPPPASPTASQFPPVPNSNVTNPSAQYRLQRTTSTPSATTQLPGGVGSPCHYGGVGKEQPLLSPSHPLSGCPATPTHNQHNANNTQHFSNHQHPSMLYHNAAGVQSSQYCYDRTPVNLYQSGPGDAQDIRPPPSSNPASHQIGGNTSSTGGINSEYVRKELRTVVDARMQQQQQQRVPNNLQNNLTAQVSQEDLESLGLTYDMASTGDALVSDGSAKSWAIGSTGTAPSSSRTTMEEVARGDPKSSLLQKLLSE